MNAVQIGLLSSFIGIPVASHAAEQRYTGIIIKVDRISDLNDAYCRMHLSLGNGTRDTINSLSLTAEIGQHVTSAYFRLVEAGAWQTTTLLAEGPCGAVRIVAIDDCVSGGIERSDLCRMLVSTPIVDPVIGLPVRYDPVQ